MVGTLRFAHPTIREKMSLPGLTRQSIPLEKTLAKRDGCAGKPAHDEQSMRRPSFTRRPSAAREVAMLQAERLDCRVRKSAPRFDLLIRSHHRRYHCGGLLRILFSHKVDRADGRTALQWLSCHQYDLTICHTPLYHHRCPRYL